MTKQCTRVDNALTMINYYRKQIGLNKYGIATTVSSTGKITDRYKVYVFDKNRESYKMPEKFVYTCNTLTALYNWLKSELQIAAKKVNL